VGEIVRRATGVAIAEQVQRLISGPLGVRMWMGLPAELDDSVIPGRWLVDPFAPATGEPAPEPGSYADLRRKAIEEAPPFEPDPDDVAGRRVIYASELPAAGVVTDARSLARMYAATQGAVDGVRLYGDGTRERMLAPQTDGVPALVETGTTGPDIRFGLGYQLPSGSMPGMGPGSYGHTGAGGRLGLADPDSGVSFGYVCSQMRIIPATGDPRWAAIVAAIRYCI
jgi:CubicO group peptidase (beta-lactamase class C family)